MAAADQSSFGEVPSWFSISARIGTFCWAYTRCCCPQYLNKLTVFSAFSRCLAGLDIAWRHSLIMSDYWVVKAPTFNSTYE